MNTTTPNLGLNKPSVSGDSDAWGTYLNDNADTLDALFLTDGTWTPAVTFATAGNLSVSYAVQAGRYSVVGDMVYVDVTLTFTPTFSTASGNLIITGLPVAANASNTGSPVGNALLSQGFHGYTPGSLTSALASTTTLLVRDNDPTNGFFPITAANMTTGVAATLVLSLWYKK